MGTKHNDTCLDKASDNEPLFVLRAQDHTAPRAILQWIAANFETCGNDKLREAFEQALKMKQWPNRKMAD